MSAENNELSTGEAGSKVEAVMARVRASVPANGTTSVSRVPARLRPGEPHLFPEDVYRSLHQARTIGGGIGVDYKLGWKTPIIGHIWMRIRYRIHQEIRIYIDALTTQQSNLNNYLIRVATHVVESLDDLGLMTLTRQQHDQAELIGALQEEVRVLREQVDRLQAQVEGSDAHHPNGSLQRTTVSEN